MHYLVTGAQGFLGAKVVKAFEAEGALVTASGRYSVGDLVGCDLSVLNDVTRLLDSVAPDCIIHCAAKVPKNLDEYEDLDSFLINLDMLDTILMASDCPIVFISSMTVYGTNCMVPVIEEGAGDPTSRYGLGKWKAELRLRDEGRPSLAIRIPGLFGPPRLNGLVYNLLRAAKYKHGVSLPESSVQWAAMHVDDAARSIAKAALSGVDDFEAINVAYSDTYSIDNLVTIVGEIYQHKIEYFVAQPSFEFNLTRAEIRGALPDSNLYESLVRFGNDI
jgi:UDP-glucose 4-epimerase